MSTGDEASRFARFAFRRHFFQHLGFRIAQSVVDRLAVRLVETPVFVLGVGVEGKFLQWCNLFSFSFLYFREVCLNSWISKRLDSHALCVSCTPEDLKL